MFINQMIENYNFLANKSLSSRGNRASLQREPIFQSKTSLKRMNLIEFNKRKTNLTQSKRNLKYDKQSIKTDVNNQRKSFFRQSLFEQDNEKQIQALNFQRNEPKSKGVRFRQRISIQSIDLKDHIPFNDIQNEQKILMLQNIVDNNNFSLPMTSRRKTSQNIRIVSNLVNSPVQSKSNVIDELKCLMCHYPGLNSQLFGNKTILIAKQKLKNLSQEEPTENITFRYEPFGYFLKNLTSTNYDSIETVNSFEAMINKQNYPISIKIMFYYMGNYLYQFNNLYDKSSQILGRFLRELLKTKIYEYVGIYLFLMAKLNANLLEWDSCVRYLMKLLAYAWLYQMENLQIWIYFQLSKSYFFLNQQENSEYFKIRSEMSIIEPNQNIYRQLIAKDFKKQMEQMRAQYTSLNLNKIITIGQLTKLKNQPQYQNRDKDTFKLQSQIKNINQQCKIKHVKNLIHRMNSSQLQEAKATRYLSSKQKTLTDSKQVRLLGGNPLLRSHQSGLKNLKIYFRNNPKGQSLLNKNRQPQLYTLQNSNKSIMIIKQLSRNILLQMKWFLPINPN